MLITNPDGTWSWRCDRCGSADGRGTTLRPADQDNPIERGYERWNEPCRACGPSFLEPEDPFAPRSLSGEERLRAKYR